MKVGILTFHDTTNFGSLLQTYALYKKLKDLNFTCEVIDYKCDEIVKRELPSELGSIKSIKELYRYIKYNRLKKKRYNSMMRFSDKYISISDEVYYKNNIVISNKDYSKFLIGSDIVWGLDITNKDYTYFLEFVEDGKGKYAYASSIGSNFEGLTVDEYHKVERLLKEFNKICVREVQGKELLSKMKIPYVDVVCDPTLLLNGYEWSKFTHHINRKPYVLVYFSDSDGKVISCAKDIAKQYSLEILYISMGKKEKGVTNVRVYSIEDFLSLIKEAEFVVTSSYHGMLFSINFNKEFYFNNRNYKSRMDTVANILGLDYRDVNYFNINELKKINYEDVNKRLEDFRTKSINTLKNMITD